MTNLKWSFDEIHIGQIEERGSALVTRIFPRPAGLSNGGWYEAAGHLCKQLNALFPPLPPIALVSREPTAEEAITRFSMELISRGGDEETVNSLARQVRHLLKTAPLAPAPSQPAIPSPDAIRREAIEQAAEIAKLFYDEHCAARDDLLKTNPEGALTRARQAQTADDIFKAIRALAAKGGE